jgi:hypothetical protein
MRHLVSNPFKPRDSHIVPLSSLLQDLTEQIINDQIKLLREKAPEGKEIRLDFAEFSTLAMEFVRFSTLNMVVMKHRQKHSVHQEGW